MEAILSPREMGKLIAETSEDVTIETEGVKKVAQLEGVPVTDPEFYSTITRAKLEEILRSDSGCVMPLLDKRLEVLHEAGKVLLKKYDGSFVNCIKKAEKSAQSLLKLIVEDFPAYRDVGEYKGKRGAFYKRAQVLISDVWGAFEGKGLGEFHDIDTLTMFADYRIPQCLVYFGALKYSDTLMETLKKGTNIPNGDRREMEIRGCSIWVTELICEEAKKLMAVDPETKDADVNAVLVDYYLWDKR